MTPDTARELVEWGTAGREYQARRAEAGTPAGVAYARRLESLSLAETVDELRPMFAQSPTARLAHDITHDLGIAPKRARLIAEEIAASRRRLEHATRPFCRRGEPADNEAG